ncbi:MAG: MBL fold metallo-hydrolase [Archaeoglobus sp.]|uniref:MBL fold metallo-hydrolase n=1 Tax=Archaeoglobus sp. TaxID=1872626 RepID=UPI001D200F03|nr:MBL fold metallo-hydrolase [Archaeoglobus sp.]MBO8180717.1 MBL fold metallo-hydrolase [Archaeoglobus sp.]
MKEVLPSIYLIDTLKYVEEGVISSYVVADAKAAIIDPGTAKGAEIILEEIDRNWNVEYICPTHIHIDHGGGAAKLAKALDAKILVHPRGAKHIINPKRLWEASKAVLGEVAETYGKPESVEEDRVIAVEDGEEFELGEEKLKAFYAPGHAPHMLAYYLTNSGVLFPADAVGMYFEGVVFPLTPPPFDADAALKTLERLMSLNVDYVAFTHYGVVEGDWTIKKSYEKIKSWMEIAKEVAEADGSVEEFVNRLRRHDEDVEKLFNVLGKKPVALSFIYTSATGMLDAARRGLQ